MMGCMILSVIFRDGKVFGESATSGKSDPEIVRKFSNLCLFKHVPYQATKSQRTSASHSDSTLGVWTLSDTSDDSGVREENGVDTGHCCSPGSCALIYL
jgi:hypothetical protein